MDETVAIRGRPAANQQGLLPPSHIRHGALARGLLQLVMHLQAVRDAGKAAGNGLGQQRACSRLPRTVRVTLKPKAATLTASPASACSAADDAVSLAVSLCMPPHPPGQYSLPLHWAAGPTGSTQMAPTGPQACASPRCRTCRARQSATGVRQGPSLPRCLTVGSRAGHAGATPALMWACEAQQQRRRARNTLTGRWSGQRQQPCRAQRTEQ